MKKLKIIVTGITVSLIALSLAACGNHVQHKDSKVESSEKTEQVSKNSSSLSSLSSISSSESSMNSTSSSNQSQIDQTNVQVSDKELGTMVCFLQSPDWFKQILNDNQMKYGIAKPGDALPTEALGYSYVVGGNDIESYIFWKKTGDQVTIKTVENPAEKHMRTRVVSYQRLLQNYYQTSQ